MNAMVETVAVWAQISVLVAEQAGQPPMESTRSSAVVVGDRPMRSARETRAALHRTVAVVAGVRVASTTLIRSVRAAQAETTTPQQPVAVAQVGP